MQMQLFSQENIMWMIICATIIIVCGTLLFFQKLIIKSYIEYNVKQHENNAILHLFCLEKVMQDAIEKEDYRTAQLCLELIESFSKEIKK